MSDVPQGEGWWQASDGRWYAPEQFQPPGAGAAPPQYQPQPFGSGPASPPSYAAPYPGYNPVPRTEGLATASLICAVAGTVLMVACGVGIAGTIAAIPLGITARRRIAQSGGQLTGDGMALAGLIIGAIMTGLAVIGWGIWFILLASSPN